MNEEFVELVRNVGARVVGVAALIGCVPCFITGGVYAFNGSVLLIVGVTLILLSSDTVWDFISDLVDSVRYRFGEDEGYERGKVLALHIDEETLTLARVKRSDNKVKVLNVSVDDSGFNIVSGCVKGATCDNGNLICSTSEASETSND